MNDHQWDETVCTRVAITSHPDRGFAEFPQHADLGSFDDDDRMFVATAVAHGGNPTILQAVDFKWRRWADALESEGIDVEFLCADP